MLLAFDTATPHVTVALHDGEDVVVELRADRPMKHAEQLAPLIEQALSAAGIVRQDLTAIAAGVGPGPFTGLRVGLVTARTLAFVLDVPVYGVCTLDVLAVEAADGATVQGGTDQGFVVATDARRKEVYLARYDAAGARLDGPVVGRPADLATDDRVVGEGGVLYPDAFPHRAGPTAPSAGWLARAVAEERAEIVDPEPLYLRRPDAMAPHAPKRVS
ncbi:tRNA (adenosine(37)-N6)-threonylcarbamoyltransferase complex dimerization subunit type 1 TsaB [Nocardioides sp.]|uniref:tRNA (adenosine(37)-N6)-threonylcarbamoyltransferase complex dimerization subunit type 1 TsaB n=1 Tax=Nocardioides sp. TaxID=35761 RepID=UPI0025F20A69|nr:tRNA (adenosine(37)-N6)-threonylcarbamoyltransferase complex dimerization subunit type 1 TsaB [Nocardioides sp.]